jgi:RNA polymerase sigma factor (sigma-70 family)
LQDDSAPLPASRGGAREAAVVQALAENHRRFLSFLERRVSDRATAEEILQAAFVRGIERAREVRDDERAVAWFYRLLRNAVVDQYRARGTEASALAAFAREAADAEEVSPDLERELCACFEALLPALKPEYAEILRRVDLAGERPAEVARSSGLTANNAMVRLHRARKALRTALERSCRTCAEHGCLDCTCRAGVRVSS